MPKVPPLVLPGQRARTARLFCDLRWSSKSPGGVRAGLWWLEWGAICEMELLLTVIMTRSGRDGICLGLMR